MACEVMRAFADSHVDCELIGVIVVSAPWVTCPFGVRAVIAIRVTINQNMLFLLFGMIAVTAPP